MFARRLIVTLILSLLACPLVLTGCGAKQETAATPDELDAFLQANPDIANDESPDVEAE